jgi:hypothetical protein
VGGDVYFTVDSFPEYGALSGRKQEENRAGERVAVDGRKRNPADFALWKVSHVNCLHLFLVVGAQNRRTQPHVSLHRKKNSAHANGSWKIGDANCPRLQTVPVKRVTLRSLLLSLLGISSYKVYGRSTVRRSSGKTQEEHCQIGSGAYA